MNKLVCRACLVTKESFSYILFENVTPELFWYCTSIEVHQDDLPKALCNTCHELLLKYSDFKKNCVQSQNTLMGYQNNFKYENEELNYNEDKKIEYNIKIEDSCNQFDADIIDVLSCGIINEKMKNEDTKTYRRLKKKKIINVKHKRKKLKLKERNHFTFTCEFCNKKFNYQERYDAHKLEHEGKTVAIHCAPCNKIFKTWNGLKRHNDSEHSIVKLKNLKCKICGKIYKNEHSLKFHKKLHGERSMSFCDVCGKGFTSITVLKTHLETHNENRERQYPCEHCGKKFFTNAILLSHISRLHQGRRYICHVCNYPFTDKYNLSRHLLLHEGKKPYKCDICEKYFSTQSSLVVHKRIHSGERPFLCIDCPKTFISKKRLVEHHRIHTGEKPYKCSICDQGFTQNGSMRRHMKIHEKGTIPK